MPFVGPNYQVSMREFSINSSTERPSYPNAEFDIKTELDENGAYRHDFIIKVGSDNTNLPIRNHISYFIRPQGRTFAVTEEVTTVHPIIHAPGVRHPQATVRDLARDLEPHQFSCRYSIIGFDVCTNRGAALVVLDMVTDQRRVMISMERPETSLLPGLPPPQRTSADVLQKLKELSLIKTKYVTELVDVFETEHFIHALFDISHHALAMSVPALRIRIHTNENGFAPRAAFKLLLGVLSYHMVGLVRKNFRKADFLVDESLPDFAMQLALFDSSNATILDFNTDSPEFIPYYAPEYLMRSRRCCHKQDTWSAGVLIAEWTTHSSKIFNGTGRDVTLDKIAKLCGTPKAEDFPDIVERRCFPFQATRRVHQPRIKAILEPFGPDFTDLISRMMTLSPDRRCSVRDAIMHPYFEPLRDMYGITEESLPIPQFYS